MTETLRVNPNVARTESSEDEVKTDPDSQSWSFVHERIPRRVPLFIPRTQAYYWTREWQQGIGESMTAYEAGDYVEFSSDDPDDVIRRYSGNEG